jgi:hypothetical protein
MGKPRSDDKISPFPIKRWDYYSTARQKNEGDLADPGGGSGSAIPMPTSGIIGYTFSVGDGTHPAYLQLLNPTVDQDIAIYEMYIAIALHATSATIYGKRTDTPVTLSTPHIGNLTRMIEDDITPIHAKLYGANGAGGVVIPESDAHHYIPPALEGSQGWKPYAIRGPLMFPLILKPGQAYEVSADTASAATKLRMSVVIDQVPVGSFG